MYRQVNLDMTDSMGPGKSVCHMQNLSYTYDTYLICMGLGPSISSVIDENLSYSGPSYPSSPVYIYSIIALSKAPQHPAWRRNCHQSGETSKNTSGTPAMLFWKLLKLANNTGNFKEVLWRESAPFSRGIKYRDWIDISGFLPIRLSAPEICRSLDPVCNNDR